jgi:ABC-type lipoprotein export system ATPase subunit
LDPSPLSLDQSKKANPRAKGRFERLGTTTIIITHNAAIAGMADRVFPSTAKRPAVSRFSRNIPRRY